MLCPLLENTAPAICMPEAKSVTSTLLALAAAGPEQKIAGRGAGRHTFLHRIGVAAM